MAYKLACIVPQIQPLFYSWLLNASCLHLIQDPVLCSHINSKVIIKDFFQVNWKCCFCFMPENKVSLTLTRKNV